MRCPRCESENVNVSVVEKMRVIPARGVLGWIWWIFLAIITFGLILIIPLLTNYRWESRRVSEAVCQNCGNHWIIDDTEQLVEPGVKFVKPSGK